MDEDSVEESGKNQPDNKKKYLLFGGATLGLVFLCVLIFFLFRSDEKPEVVARTEVSVPVVDVVDPDEVLTGALMHLDPIVVNLRNNSGYIKFAADIEYFDFALPYDEALHRIRAHDILIKVLSGKTPDDLLSVESKIALRKEMVESLNTVEYYKSSSDEYAYEEYDSGEYAADEYEEDGNFDDAEFDAEIVDIFFTEFVIQ